MAKNYNFFVYILASDSGTLYVGVTNNIERRLYEHRNNLTPGFACKYGCHKLVYIEHYSHIDSAINREKQIKRWRREKKEFLIKTINPSWKDLSCEWYR
jgi:putative endonuclease